MTNERQSLPKDFEQVVRDEYCRVYRFALHLAGDESAAIDLTQDGFRAAWEGWSSFKGRSSVSTWLHQIVYRQFVDTRRREKCRRQALEAAALHVADLGRDVGEVVQIQQDIRSAVQRLPEAEKVVITLRYFQGLSVEETSLVTGEPIGTIKWRTRNALILLRQQLGGMAYERIR